MSLGFSSEDILVADRSLFPYVYGLKESHPDFAFKLLDEDQLLDLASFRFAKDPIPQLLVNGLSYPNAKRYSLLLRMGLADKDAEAKAFMDSLGPDGIVVDPLGEFELRQGKVYFLEKKEDIELHRLLKERGIEVTDIAMADLGVDVTMKKAEGFVFKNRFAQYSHIFASIREKLLEDPGYAKRCYIQVGDLSDVFYARLLGSAFGIETYYRYKSPLLGEPEYTRLYQSLRQRGSITLTAEEAETEEGKDVLSMIKEYRLDEVARRDRINAITRLYEILSSRSIDRQIGEKGILLSSSFTVSGKKEIYLTDFQDGPFYKCFTDDDYFNDAQMLSMGMNPSYVKTQLEKRLKELYLRLNKFALISRVKEHLDDKIYDSPLAKELGIELKPLEKVSTSGVFTSASSFLLRGASLDETRYPLPLEDLRGYDSRFQGIKDYATAKKDRYSVTNLESYLRCPYAYYMKTVMPKTRYDHDVQYLGVFVHKILEGVDNPDYDYEASFAKGIEAYIDEMKKYDEAPGPREAVIFALVKTNFRRTIALIRSRNSHCNLTKSYSELKLNWTLKDGEREYPFYGVADNVSVYQSGAMTFFTISDYKSGSEDFLPYGCFLGASTQLPLYAYALTKGESKGLVEGKFAGMGLQHVYPNSLKSAFTSKDVFNVRFGYKAAVTEGVYLNDASFWGVFDDTAVDKDGNPTTVGTFASCGKKTFDLSGAGTLSGINGGRSYSLDDLLDDAVRATLAVIHRIEEGDFPIAPSPRDPRAKADGNLPCEYCAYIGICYHDKDRDARSFRDDINDYFRKKEDDNGED